MSIRGIDNQMMVTRSTEITKDAALISRRNDLMQDYLSVQLRAEAERDSEAVQRHVEAQQVDIQPDRDGGSGDSYQPGEGNSQRKKEQPTETDKQFVPGEQRRIDIKV